MTLIQTVESLHPGDADHDAVLDLATLSVRQALARPLDLVVDRLDRQGYWIFLLGRLRTAEGEVPDFSGAAAATGATVSPVSDAYAALFRQNDEGEWQKVAETIGPGDVAWLTWPQKHGVPGSVLGF